MRTIIYCRHAITTVVTVTLFAWNIHIHTMDHYHATHTTNTVVLLDELWLHYLTQEINNAKTAAQKKLVVKKLHDLSDLMMNGLCADFGEKLHEQNSH